MDDEVSIRLSPSQAQRSSTTLERSGTPQPSSPVKQNTQGNTGEVSTGFFKKTQQPTTKKRVVQESSDSSGEDADDERLEIIEDPPVVKKKVSRGVRSIYIR